MAQQTDNKIIGLIKSLRQYVLFFIMYSIFGWIYEVFLEVVVYRWGFSNRGFLFGPYCPVYGFGAMIFLFCVYPLIKNKRIDKKLILCIPVFLLCMASATLLELLTSYLMEWTTGSWPWQTYADYKINFQARIALSPSIRFGIGGVVFLYIIQPLFEKAVAKLSDKKLTIASISVLAVLLIDLLYTIFLR